MNLKFKKKKDNNFQSLNFGTLIKVSKKISFESNVMHFGISKTKIAQEMSTKCTHRKIKITQKKFYFGLTLHKPTVKLLNFTRMNKLSK